MILVMSGVAKRKLRVSQWHLAVLGHMNAFSFFLYTQIHKDNTIT